MMAIISLGLLLTYSIHTVCSLAFQSERIKSGKRNADKAFTGFLMKATKGQANPQVALKLLAQELAKLKEE